MNIINFSANAGNQYKIAILIKGSSFNRQSLETYYVNELVMKGLEAKDIMAVDLAYEANNKVSVKRAKDNINAILPLLDKLGVDFILCADSAHYKQLTSQKKPDSNIDNVTACTIKDYGHIKVGYTINYGSLLYNPDQKDKITTSLNTMASAVAGNYSRIQVKFAEERYPMGVEAIKQELDYLLQFDELAVDIEAFGLRLGEAGIGTISFANDIDKGSAFLVDYYPIREEDGFFAIQRTNFAVRKLLKQFFIDYQGNLTAHNCAYDFKQLIWELFMKDPLDKKGMLQGLFILTKNFDDTKIMAYCALNSTSKPSKKLKDLGYDYAGDYAQDDIKDIRRIETFQLLKYNLTDACTTLWVKDRLMPIVIRDKQLEFYEKHCLPMQRVLLQVELHGMPMDDDRIQEVKAELEGKRDYHKDCVIDTDQVDDALSILRKRAVERKNLTLVRKRVTEDDFDGLEFNPNSGDQLRILLHDVMGLPVIEKTDKGNPKTDNKTLKSLVNHAKDDMERELLTHLVEYNGVKKICSDFIPNFEKGILKADGRRYLHGSFNIGGTVSGRLSSSDPNLQNLPAGSDYGKKVKYIFRPPMNHLMLFSDFNSLEDYISALLSKDPNKMKVYTDGYDGHCLRAFAYFPQKLPGIINTVDSINSIKKLFPDVRQDSKAPTFLLTYLGTYHGLMKNCGFSEEASKMIEGMYHELYEVSDTYTEGRIEEAAQLGYTTLAFGLRLRCPMLKRTVDSKSKYALRGVRAEERTLGNAFGQSYGLLNNRAMVDFMDRVWESEYKYDIMPIAPIHDASYYITVNDVKVVKFVNDNLIDAMKWQEDPAIAHDTVKIGAELDVCYDSWDTPITLPNDASIADIMRITSNYVAELDSEEDEELDERLMYAEDEEAIYE